MVKRILIISAIFACMQVFPAAASTMEPEMDAPQPSERMDVRNINIAVSQSTLTVTGANGMTLEVVSLTGRPVASFKIESQSQRVELNNLPKGCYILKIGKVVRKVTIR